MLWFLWILLSVSCWVIKYGPDTVYNLYNVFHFTYPDDIGYCVMISISRIIPWGFIVWAVYNLYTCEIIFVK